MYIQRSTKARMLNFIVAVLFVFSATNCGPISGKTKSASHGPIAGKTKSASHGPIARKTKSASRVHVVEIRSNKHSPLINQTFLGTNNLYWIDNDIAWKNERFVRELKALGLGSLRFPGGEVADNYDWETNRLERSDQFPYEAKSEAERLNRLDYKEFLAHAKAANIPDIFFVVNFESAFFRPGNLEDNINLYAEKAARWVKAVHDSGYRVGYWEIGNESYLKSKFALTAHEYANALKIFYRKMKAVDPSIKIGAIGPPSFNGRDAVSFADRMTPNGLADYRNALLQGNEPCAKNNKELCMQKFGVPESRQADLPIWWDIVLNEASDSFDFAVIHRYRTSQMKGGKNKVRSNENLSKYISELKAHIESGKHAPIQLSLTEWNTPDESKIGLNQSAHALEITELIGNYLEGGVDFTMYWPLRLRGNSYSLLTLDGMEPTPSFQALALVRRYVGEQISTTSENYDDLYFLSTEFKGGHKVLMVNKSNKNKCIKFVVDGAVVEITSGEVLSDIMPKSVPRKLLPKELQDNGKSVCIPGRAVVGLLVNFPS